MNTELENLQAQLSTAYAGFLQIAAALEPVKCNQPGACGEWSPKDVISHLNGWDKLMQTFIADPDTFDSPDNIDVFNANSVLERQHLSWEESMIELHRGFCDLQEAIATVTLDMQIYGRVCGWLNGRREDYDFHALQLSAWNQENREFSSQE